MLLLIVLVFAGVFIVTALLIAASGVDASEREKQTVARLDSVLAADITKPEDDLDFRRSDQLSSIPLLNRILLEFEIAPKLRMLLYQANLNWTPGLFLLSTLSIWVFSSYL